MMEPDDQIIARLDEDQKALWMRVVALWDLLLQQDIDQIRKCLHPDFTGWVTGLDSPHGFDAAIRSAGPDAPHLLRYHLVPLRVTVFDRTVGIVHYRYEADVEIQDVGEKHIAGRWTEIYMFCDGGWIMISVSGGPDGQR